MLSSKIVNWYKTRAKYIVSLDKKETNMILLKGVMSNWSKIFLYYTKYETKVRLNLSKYETETCTVQTKSFLYKIYVNLSAMNDLYNLKYCSYKKCI